MKKVNTIPIPLINLIVIFLNLNIYSQDSWFWQNPWPQGNSLSDVAAIDKNTMIAGGGNSVILTTNDGGDSWQVQYYEELNTEINSIFFLNENKGWICGTNKSESTFGIILRTDDGGSTWDRVDILPNIDFQEIQFFDNNIGWLSGINTITSTPYIFKTNNGGYSWQEQKVSNKEAYKCKVKFFHPDTGIINFRDDSYYLDAGEFLTTTDGGVTWDSLYSGFTCLYFKDTQNGWTTINRAGWSAWFSVYSTNDGGHTWEQDTTKSGGGFAYNIYFSDTLLTTNI